MSDSDKKTVERLAELLGAQIPIDDALIQRICNKTNISAQQSRTYCAKDVMINQMEHIRHELLFIPSYRRSSSLQLNQFISAAKKIRNVIKTKKIVFFDNKAVNDAYLGQIHDMLYGSLLRAENDAKASARRPAVLRKIIGGVIADSYADIFNRRATTSFNDGSREGPFVRFVQAVFDEFAPQLTPVSTSVIQQAAIEWQSHEKKRVAIIELLFAEPDNARNNEF